MASGLALKIDGPESLRYSSEYLLIERPEKWILRASLSRAFATRDIIAQVHLVQLSISPFCKTARNTRLRVTASRAI